MQTATHHHLTNVGISAISMTGISMVVIDQLDLGPIKVKLMRDEGWSVEQVNLAEKWYKRFLFLNFMYPSTSLVISKTLDKFWHHHILDTQKYAEDCQKVFGYFLHHFPYFGMRGDEDAKNLSDAFANTKKLLIQGFDESLNNLCTVFSAQNADVSAECDSDCTGGGCGECGSINMDQSRPVFLN